jgi:hypothetical protein
MHTAVTWLRQLINDLDLSVFVGGVEWLGNHPYGDPGRCRCACVVPRSNVCIGGQMDGKIDRWIDRSTDR